MRSNIRFCICGSLSLSLSLGLVVSVRLPICVYTVYIHQWRKPFLNFCSVQRIIVELPISQMGIENVQSSHAHNGLIVHRISISLSFYSSMAICNNETYLPGRLCEHT